MDIGKILAILKVVIEVVRSDEFKEIVAELKKLFEELKKLFEGFFKPSEK